MTISFFVLSYNGGIPRGSISISLPLMTRGVGVVSSRMIKSVAIRNILSQIQDCDAGLKDVCRDNKQAKGFYLQEWQKSSNCKNFDNALFSAALAGNSAKLVFLTSVLCGQR